MTRTSLTLIWRLLVITGLAASIAVSVFDLRIAAAILVFYAIFLVCVRQYIGKVLAKQWAAQYGARRDEFLKKFKTDPEMAARMVGAEWHPLPKETGNNMEPNQ